MTVGERIKNIRTKLGISQVAFADKIGVSKQTLYKYENNIITNIPSDKIEAIAKLSGYSPSYFMGWDNEEADNTENTGYYLNEQSVNLINNDTDLTIIQRERSKMSDKEKTKLMNILKANFDDYNWEEDDSGNIE
ncbi:MAG: helix-turn-helix domain-containing protein [Lachnospiraceae bacterium]